MDMLPDDKLPHTAGQWGYVLMIVALLIGLVSVILIAFSGAVFLVHAIFKAFFQ